MKCLLTKCHVASFIKNEQLQHFFAKIAKFTKIKIMEKLMLDI